MKIIQKVMNFVLTVRVYIGYNIIWWEKRVKTTLLKLIKYMVGFHVILNNHIIRR